MPIIRYFHLAVSSSSRFCTRVFDFHSKIFKLLKTIDTGLQISQASGHFGSLGHTCTLNFCPNLVQDRFRNMYLKESLTRFSMVIWRVKSEANFIWSGAKIVKRLRSRQYDPAVIERSIHVGVVLGPFIALYRSFLKASAHSFKRLLHGF